MNRLSIFTVILALVVLSVFFLKDSQIQQIDSSTDPELVVVKEALFELQQQKSFQNLSKEKKLEKTYQLLEMLPPEYRTLKRQYQIAMSSLPDIGLYGRVLDQYGDPVSSADVLYAGTSAFLAEGGGRGKVITDSDGYFEIDTTGAVLSLWAVEHPSIQRGGYSAVTNINKNINSSNMYPDWTKHESKDNPYIVQVWRISEYAGAIGGYESIRINSDGAIYTLKLDVRTGKIKVVKGESAGLLRISCQRAHMKSNRDYGDWLFSISAINGGLQESNDLYLNLAPKTGYQYLFSVDMKKSSSGYKHELIDKRFYFRANDEKEYGSLLVNFQPFSNAEKEVCNMRFTYKLNSTGSRNLELKRNGVLLQPEKIVRQKLASNL